MERGLISAIVGAQYGSEGKGTIVAYLANKYNVHIRVGAPNAGHTFYWKGQKHVQRSIPCGWTNPEATIVIGRGALIDMDCLFEELHIIEQHYPDFRKRLKIDAEAGILSKEFKDAEGGVNGAMHARIGSTGEGVGPARIARIMRDPQKFKRFGDIADQMGVLGLGDCMVHDTPRLIYNLNRNGANVLIEGTQGSGLSLLHSDWPYCTSTDTNAAQMLADIGIAPALLDEVILVARTFPIRVAGNSGPMFNEITWQYLSNRVGKPISERTTVTKKTRRVGMWDIELFRRAVLLNQPSKIAITFADYVDPALYQCTDPRQVASSEKFMGFIVANGLLPYLQNIHYIATGPDTVVNIKGGGV